MKAAELIAKYRACGPQSMPVFLHFLADHAGEVANVTVWLRELAEAARLPDPVPDPLCPDCRHVHEGRTECKKYLGEGKFCPCESKVTA